MTQSAINSNNLKASSSVDPSSAGGSAISAASPLSLSPPPQPCFSFPLPDLPVDGPILFESIIFAYSIVALLLQYLHLYRTVWWLPHSYTNLAVNFYLIDPQLIYFSALLLGRRLVWNVERKVIVGLSPLHWIASVVLVARSLTTLFILTGLLYLAYGIMQQHPVVNMLYLAYPISVYFLLFGLVGEPFLELCPAATCNCKIKIYRDKSGVYRTTSPVSAAAAHLGGPAAPTADAIRNEVAVLKSNFNMRLKQVLFNSIVSAYYATFVPCCFAQGALHYELGWVGRHVALVWVGCFTLYATQCFPSAYTHMLHRTAMHLGQWTKIEGRVSPNFYCQWAPSTSWSANAIVRHGKDLFKAEGLSNAAEPGNLGQIRFYWLFKDPSLGVGVLLVCQSGLVVAQHISLTWSTYWYQLISEAILLFANYYVLFKLIRDYLVLWKIYLVESTLQAKD